MKAAFVFSGQGAQFVGMGKDLCGKSAAAAVFEKADKALGWSVSDTCFNGPETKLVESRHCQPAIFTMSVACLEGFKALHPQSCPLAVGGLSLGEFAALHAAGVFTFEDGLRLVAKRGELMQVACAEAKGGMASVIDGDPDVIRTVCKECDIDVANYNCPGQIVISGTEAGVQRAVEILKGKGARRVIPLKVAGAFHSRLMKKAEKAFEEFLATVPMSTPATKVVQNFVGTTVENVDQIRRNLVAQVSGSVRWEECVRAILNTGADTVIEFGPGNVLTGLIRRIAPGTITRNMGDAKSLELEVEDGQKAQG